MVDRDHGPTPRIVLRARGSGVVVRLDAVALVAQYAVCDSRTLIVLDDDTPYEEQLHLALLHAGDVLDHVVIGAPYASGVFRPVESAGGTLCFRFESDAIWTVSVRAEGRRGWGALPTGAQRRTSLLAPQYLVLAHGAS